MVFQLHPFFQENVVVARPAAAAFDITCRIELQGRGLHFEFVVPKAQFSTFGWNTKPISGGLIKANTPTEGLWKDSCFELFVSQGGDEYWEWNFSLTGEWNLYHFTGYRKGQTQPEIELSKFNISKTEVSDRLIYQGQVATLKEVSEIWVNPTAVSKDANGKINYWAPRHPKAKADFHLHDCFIRLA